MSSRAHDLWANSFAGLGDGEEAPGEYNWLDQPEPERSQSGPVESAQLPIGGAMPGGGAEPGQSGSLDAALDFADLTQDGASVDAPPASGASADVGGFGGFGGAGFGPIGGGTAGAGLDGGGELYTRPDASFPDFTGFTLTDIDFSFVLDIDIEMTVTLVQNIFIDIDVPDGGFLFLEDLAGLIPDMNVDLDDLGLGDFGLGNFASNANGFFGPDVIDSFADLGGFGGAGGVFDIDVSTLIDLDIVTNVNLIQNVVIDIDVGEDAGLFIGDPAEFGELAGLEGPSASEGATVGVDVAFEEPIGAVDIA